MNPTNRQNPALYLELSNYETSPPSRVIFGPLRFATTICTTEVQFAYTNDSKPIGFLPIRNGFIHYDNHAYTNVSTFPAIPTEHAHYLTEFDQTKISTPQTRKKLLLGNSKLGNPLSVISGYVRMALQPSATYEQIERYLNEIAKAITEAISLTKQHHILCLNTVSFNKRHHLLINDRNTADLFQFLGPFDSMNERDHKAEEISKFPDVIVFTIDGPASSIEINSTAIPK